MPLLERRVWSILLGLGVASLVIFAIPSIVYVGFALLVVPGLLIWATPVVFMYGLVAMLAWTALRVLPSGVRVVAAASAVAALASIPPARVNDATEQAVQAWIAGDVPLKIVVPSGDTIALLQGRSPEETFHSGASTDCDELCQRLLFNGTFKRVLMGISKDGAEVDLPQDDLIAYRLERRPECPPPRLPANSPRWTIGWIGEGASVKNARDRVAAGECLIEDRANPREAELLFVERGLYESTDISRWSLKPFIYNVKRIELLRQNGTALVPLFRLTEVHSDHIARPFVIGISDWQFPFAAGFGILRSVVTVNRLDAGAIAKSLFGRSVGPIERGTIDDVAAERILAKALANPALPYSDARFSLADRVLKWIASKPTPTSEDAQLVHAVANDDRFKEYVIPAETLLALGPQAHSIIEALVERLLTLPLPQEEQAVDRAAWAVWNAPPGALAQSADRLERLAQTPGRRRIAYYAIGRLADAGEGEAPYLGRLVRSYENWRARPTDDERKLVLGALMGLCRLGSTAQSQRQAVVDLLKVSHRPGSKMGGFDYPAMIVLMEMGVGPELDTIFSEEPDLRRLAREVKEKMKVVNWQCGIG
jgi:hypothetical protein